MILTEGLLTTIKELASSAISQAAMISVLDISKPTFYSWKRKGKEQLLLPEEDRDPKKEIYIKFYKAVTEGKITNVKNALEKITTDDTWRSAAWYLERTMPEHYGRTTRFDMENFEVELRKHFSDEVVDEVLNLLVGDIDAQMEARVNPVEKTEEEGSLGTGPPIDDVPHPLSQVPPEERYKFNKNGELLTEDYNNLPDSIFQSPQERAARGNQNDL